MAYWYSTYVPNTSTNYAYIQPTVPQVYSMGTQATPPMPQTPFSTQLRIAGTNQLEHGFQQHQGNHWRRNSEQCYSPFTNVVQHSCPHPPNLPSLSSKMCPFKDDQIKAPQETYTIRNSSSRTSRPKSFSPIPGVSRWYKRRAWFRSYQSRIRRGISPTTPVRPKKPVTKTPHSREPRDSSRTRFHDLRRTIQHRQRNSRTSRNSPDNRNSPEHGNKNRVLVEDALSYWPDLSFDESQ